VLLDASGLVALAVLLAMALTLLRIDVPPRTLAGYLERRLEQHDGLPGRAGAWLARLLTAVDRGERAKPIPLAIRIGAQAESPPPPAGPAGNPVVVTSAREARRAIEHARAGDVITFEPGNYRLSGSGVVATQPGRADAPIVVRAARPRSVVIEVDNLEGFVVAAPFWQFENLTIRGVCRDHSRCEHAFHVVGKATNFVARNNTLIDFNAHIKVNGQDRRFPDDGRVEGNTLTNSTARDTDAPVTPFDLVAASRWTVQGNLITDFVKARGDRISYGAFVKGGGSENRFQRNVVLCEDLLRGAPGSRVGLSLGGGGSARGGEFCRDGTCAIEQHGGSIESNLIAFCSDDGIYVNRGANSRIASNTLIDTGGIVVRFVESGGAVEGNLVDGAIRSRDGGSLHARDNLTTGTGALYLGLHPQRRLFRDALAGDLTWAVEPPRRPAPAHRPPDLCQGARPLQPAYGAFEDIGPCLASHPIGPTGN
jgi:hypothetical protein